MIFFHFWVAEGSSQIKGTTVGYMYCPADFSEFGPSTTTTTHQQQRWTDSSGGDRVWTGGAIAQVWPIRPPWPGIRGPVTGTLHFVIVFILGGVLL